MPFPTNVRNEALVRAARHCCVCHRYKGLKVEVHHIIQEAGGGTNTLDNAIALCADCHTDAGHYNPRHPRGTKFSPEELRLARDRWHDTVHRGTVESPSQSDLLYCRYLVCKSFEAIHEIVGGNISDFPFKDSVLLRTPAFGFFASVVIRHKESFRLPREWGGSFQSEEEYVRMYPESVKISDTFAHGQQWLQYERIPTEDELRRKIAPKDYISNRLLEAGLRPEAICRVRAFTDGCGNVLLQEEYRLRSFWVVFLVITNESNGRIRLLSLGADVEGTEEPAPIVAAKALAGKKPQMISFPSAEISTNATVVIPVATILGPKGEIVEEHAWTTREDVATGQMQEFSHGCFPGTVIDECSYWGPVIRPHQIRFVHEGSEKSQEVHQLDLGNLYVVDRYWEMGSCPHLFSISRAGAVRYLGEVFTGSPSVPRVVSLDVDHGVNHLVLAELEDETSLIHSVSQGDGLLAENVLLQKGEYLVIPVAGNDPVTFTGQYDLLSNPPAHAHKNLDRVQSLIQSFSLYLTEIVAPSKHLGQEVARSPTRVIRSAAVQRLTVQIGEL